MTDQGLFAEISQGLAERLVAAGTRIRYPPGKYLFQAGEESHAAYIVEDGLLRVDRTTPSGKQVLVTLIRAGVSLENFRSSIRADDLPLARL